VDLAIFEEPKTSATCTHGLLLLGTALLAPLTAHARRYPSQPIRIVVPYAAGAAVDVVARTIGRPLMDALRQPVIVDNRPGASANIVTPGTPDQFAAFINSQTELWSGVVKSAGIKPD
jgi:MFS superfamily sulfate permease-like transporter